MQCKRMSPQPLHAFPVTAKRAFSTDLRSWSNLILTHTLATGMDAHTWAVHDIAAAWHCASCQALLQVTVPLEIALVKCTPFVPSRSVDAKKCQYNVPGQPPCNMATGVIAGVLGSGWAATSTEVTPKRCTPLRNQKQEAANEEEGTPADWASPGGGLCPRGAHPGQICLAAGQDRLLLCHSLGDLSAAMCRCLSRTLSVKLGQTPQVHSLNVFRG